jgi:undecaprenyl phosphate-alpha-L-ara4N flippase subunit ArnE
MTKHDYFPWFFLFIAAINSTIGNILLKKSQTYYIESGFLSNLFNIWFVAGVVFYAVSVVFFAKALNNLSVSIAYPILAGLGFLMLSIASNYFLNERLSFLHLIGMFLILSGIFFMTIN